MELVNYNLLKQVGFHDPNLKIFEDYDLRIRLSRKARIISFQIIIYIPDHTFLRI